MKEKVYVAIPSLRNTVTGDIATWFYNLAALSGAADHPRVYRPAIFPYQAPIAYARNICVGRFLATDCDRLLFLDDDMAPPDDWPALFDSEADIVGGPCLILHYKDGAMNVRHVAGTSWGPRFRTCDVSHDGPVDVVGTGCMLIKRRVFESPSMKLDGRFVDLYADLQAGDDWKPGEGGHSIPPYFRMGYAANGRLTYGEDYDFCWRAKLAGFSVELAKTDFWDQRAMVSLNAFAAAQAQTIKAVSEQLRPAEVA